MHAVEVVLLPSTSVLCVRFQTHHLQLVLFMNGVDTDINICQGSKWLSEFFDLFKVSLNLFALFVFSASFLLNVKAQILKKDDLALYQNIKHVWVYHPGYRLRPSQLRVQRSRWETKCYNQEVSPILPQQASTNTSPGLFHPVGRDGTSK